MSIANLNLNLLSQTIESEGKPTSKVCMKQLSMSLFFMGGGELPAPPRTVKGLTGTQAHSSGHSSGNSSEDVPGTTAASWLEPVGQSQDCNSGA